MRPANLQRIQALRNFNILDTAPDPVFDTLTRIAANIFEVSTSLISFVDQERQWFKSRLRFDREETSLQESFCALAIKGSNVFVVPDASKDRRFDQNPLVRDGSVRFYAGAPLVTTDNHGLGTICVLDTAPRQPSAVQLEMLQELACITMGLLDAHRSGMKLDADKEFVHGLADSSPGGLFEFARDASGAQWLNYASRGIMDTVGVAPDVATDDVRRVFSNVHVDDRAAFQRSIDKAYHAVARWEHQFRVVHPAKGTISILGVSHPVREQYGVVTWQGCLMDVTERVAERENLKEARNRLRKQNRELKEYQILLNQIARMSKVGAWKIDYPSKAVSWTPEVYNLHGIPSTAQITVDEAVAFCEPSMRPELELQLKNTLETGQTLEVEYPITTPAGERRWVRTVGEAEFGEDGGIVRLIGSAQDITKEQELLARALHHSSHDHMTGLPNRASFFRHLDKLLAKDRTGAALALFFFDLDHFKDINDAFGYEVGDLVIQEIAQRLRLHFDDSPDAFISRFGGDEFVILLFQGPDEKRIEETAERIKASITRELLVEGRRLTCGLSMGVALSAEGSELPSSLFRKADLALRHAKKSGRARFAFYTDELAAATEQDHTLRREIVAGIQRDEFEVFYQPIIDLRTSMLDGFEALLRWHHPQRGLTSAGIFAHLIDDPVIGQRLSDLVFRQVTDTAREWMAAGRSFGQIAINISSVQLRDPFFIGRLQRVVDAGLPSSCIKLEITEGVLLGRTADKAAQVLAQIREMGFDIALDDFGTGYASLVHLTQFPITQLKIDMSFVRKMATSDKDRTIVQTMCALAEGLQLTAVAEGIEDEATELMLRQMGCHFGQGYRYAKALPPIEAERFILNSMKSSSARA